MFKVRISVVGALGNEEKYPCHFHHKVGDEIIFNGESFYGKLCPSVWALVIPHVEALYNAGPRYRVPGYYAPIWYCPTSVKDPSKEVYDGRGFRNVLETQIEPQYHMANLVPPHSFEWPPHPEREILKNVSVTCKDLRTAVVFRIEAFDLADAGISVPFYRRQMVILSRLMNKQSLTVDEILSEFSREEQEDIYPALSRQIMIPLVEELDLLDYVDISDGKVYVTEKGKHKLESFKSGLNAAEIEALKI
jgi:uncharacterized repeat protein (TIGR04076 family)